MKAEHIPKKSLVIWEIFAILGFSLLLLLILYIFKPYTLFWYALLWILGAVFILTTFLYLPLLYYSCTYALSKENLIITRGVFMYKTHYLKLSQISFVSVYTNPLTEKLNLSSIIVTGAGARVRILFIEHTKALELAKILSAGNRFTQI